jgi:flagellar hook-associated protein 3 FlgL
MTRVTQAMLNTKFLSNLNANYQRLEHLQNQLSSGRKINKPSDDPVGISFALRYRSELNANAQYQSNTDAANSWLSFTDTVLAQAGEVMQKLRELAVKAANGTNPQAALDAIAAEAEQLYKQVVGIGNSSFNGKYVFNGELTDLPPYTEENAVNELADSAEILFETGAGVRVAVSVSGNRVFGTPDDDDNAFAIIQDFITGLRNGDKDALQEAIGNFQSRMDKILNIRSEIGSRMKRIELAEERLKDVDLNLTEMLSKTEDADLALVITKLKMDEAVYQASLSAGARLIQPSLLDHLR